MRRHGGAKTRNSSRGVIRRNLKFMGVQNTTLARVTLWRWNASGRTVISLSGTFLALLVSLIFSLVNTSITFFTMIALSNGAVIRWQPFGVSYLPGATHPISVTGATCCFPFLGGLAGVLRLSCLFGRWHVVGALYVGFSCLLRTGEILTLKAGPNNVVCGLRRCSVGLAGLPKVPNSRTWVSQVLYLTPQRGRCSLSSVGAARLKTEWFVSTVKDWHPLSSQQQLLFDYRSSDLLPNSLGLLSTSLVLGP